jgi:hypothetical protein
MEQMVFFYQHGQQQLALHLLQMESWVITQQQVN